MFDTFLEMLVILFTVICTDTALINIIEAAKYPERKNSFIVGGIFAIVSCVLWYMTYCQDSLCYTVSLFLFTSLIIRLQFFVVFRK